MRGRGYVIPEGASIEELGKMLESSNMEACRIAHTFCRPDLLALFATDRDGHIRAFVRTKFL